MKHVRRKKHKAPLHHRIKHKHKSLQWLIVFGLLLILGGLVYSRFSSNEKPPQVATTTLDTTKPAVVKKPSLTISPIAVRQGDPMKIIVGDLGTTTMKSLTFNGRALSFFRDGKDYAAFVGLDLRMSAGTYPLIATFNNGQKVEKKIVVARRNVVQETFGIPDKLGGNNPQAEKELVNTLAQEAAIMNSIPTANEKLWSGTFRYPLDPPIVVNDEYGYSRITGGSQLSHKGTDFKAEIGRRVYAMNDGTVRYVGYLRNYGNVIVIDHGLGLHTVYMHLSEISVALNQNVDKGDTIGRSGDTGYVLGPHLHLSIRIRNVSIDPEMFLELFGE